MATIIKGSDLVQALANANQQNLEVLDLSVYDTPQKGSDSTTGGDFVLKANNYQGTAGDDVATLNTFAAPNQTLRLGLGDDSFRFGGLGTGALNSKLNGVVSFGEENDASGNALDNDTVFLANQLSDYKFTLRQDGAGIKVQYIGSDPAHQIDGAAVTFYGAERFVFRNIETHQENGQEVQGVNLQTYSISAEDLVGLIQTYDHMV